ncbi:MAG: tRNA pseudouridine(55) synthase TruB [Bacteroidota bacterium]
MTPDFISGEVILIDKPLGWTSFDAVNKIRWNIKRHLSVKKIKVGHAGTLDPLATGLLIICSGKFTKRIEEFQAQEKEYIATFRLGGTTPCFDLEKEVDKTYPTEHITETMIHEAVKSFVGVTSQIPPIFSAKKIDGVRAYESARQNIEVEIQPRDINISAFEIININFPDIEARICCSKGTYIRAIARDLGEKLNSGAHLIALRRTKIGNFSVENAKSVESFVNSLKNENDQQS